MTKKPVSPPPDVTLTTGESVCDGVQKSVKSLDGNATRTAFKTRAGNLRDFIRLSGQVRLVHQSAAFDDDTVRGA